MCFRFRKPYTQSYAAIGCGALGLRVQELSKRRHGQRLVYAVHRDGARDKPQEYIFTSRSKPDSSTRTAIKPPNKPASVRPSNSPRGTGWARTRAGRRSRAQTPCRAARRARRRPPTRLPRWVARWRAAPPLFYTPGTAPCPRIARLPMQPPAPLQGRRVEGGGGGKRWREEVDRASERRALRESVQGRHRLTESTSRLSVLMGRRNQDRLWNQAASADAQTVRSSALLQHGHVVQSSAPIVRCRYVVL